MLTAKTLGEVLDFDGLQKFLILLIIMVILKFNFVQRLFLTYQWQEIPCARFFLGLWYIFDGPQTIQNAYDKSNGKPFKVPTPANHHVLVSSDEHIQEVINAPSALLSLHAVAKEMLQPKYTMCGFEWQDRRGVEGTGFVRALRSLLTAHLPQFTPKLQKIVQDGLSSEFNQYKTLDGSSQIPISKTIKRLIVNCNIFVFFGEDLLHDPDFIDAALQFPQDVIVAAEAVRLVPSLVAPFVASLITRGHKSSKKMIEVLTPIIQHRLEYRNIEGKTYKKPVDCMQWIIDTSPKSNPWNAQRMLGEVMAIWFSSIHQLAMTTTFTLMDLCIFPDYAESIRQELKEVQGASDCLPILNSFIKESMRYNSIDAISCRRKALAPFVFSGGFSVNAGDWICIPQQAIMRDKLYFDDPQCFNGFRFLPKNSQVRNENGSIAQEDNIPFTSSSPTWLIWGAGTTLCPGRFYAGVIMKLILANILQEYDFCLLDQESSRFITWRSSTVPKDGILMRFMKIEGHSC